MELIQTIEVPLGPTNLIWEETFNHFGSKLDRKTAVHNWLGDGVAEQVVKVGLRCIWGEHIVGSDIAQTIWSRVAAAAGDASIQNRSHSISWVKTPLGWLSMRDQTQGSSF
ncbi:hypothetical protein L1987_11645 [Smallanthus sonchifolius]|uniref:Uncharacterized protein n=1 Tax=Smallanthus sonchifolius TaxID=185202 RepID=A0ACB9JDT1_9ASTR|nr:hypothetical protein L1987_11645 [Smallanthus sonchifolius]